MTFEPEIEDILENNKNKKKRVNSKSKGNRSELKICKILSLHFEKLFNRVPNSGAFGTSHILEKNARDILAGDIITPEGFLFVLENKCGYDIDLINLFSSEDNGHKKLFFDFIKQASRDAKRTDRLPMVIYTKDRRPTLACLPTLFFKDIAVAETSFQFQMSDENFPEWQWWTMMSLEELLKLIPKESFYQEVKA
jgi:hypothetical protein